MTPDQPDQQRHDVPDNGSSHAHRFHENCPLLLRRPDAPPEIAQDTGTFDLQAHRGGRGLWTEGSLAAFANSLALGVTTLELDTHLTEDGKIIVWHDDTIQPGKCIDTAQPTEGDPKLPYVDDRLAELSLAQVKTLNCGFTQPPGYAEQEIIEDNRIPELNDVYQLARDHKANQVRFNIETLNTKAEMERLIDLGVDDIITDFPTRLRALMEKRGLKLPEAAPNS